MLEALEGPKHRYQKARVQNVPIPVRGWSTRDKYTGSFTRDALKYCPYIRNWMVIDGRLTVRPGFTTHATGMTNPVEAVFQYSAIGGTRTIFAASNGGAGACTIWNVTSAGAATSVTTALNSARWQHCMFSNQSSVYLLIANGTDAYRAYDGTNWTTPALTGVNSTDIIQICPHKGRLWMVEENTLSAWYLPAFAITGTVSEFDLAPFCKKGGSLMAIASWSYDGGSGPDDYIVFITTEGEMIVYAGLDPNSTAEWSLVGIFECDKPISRRCFSKLGADLVVFTESGLVQVSQVLNAVAPRDQLSDPIRDEFIGAVTTARSTYGWEVTPYTRRGWLIANIPTGVGSLTSKQFIYNPLMGAWFAFTDMNAWCWVQSGNNMYFGGTGVVYVWDNGQIDDDGAAVTADVAMAWWNYGTGTSKLFTLIRPHFFTDGTVTPSVELKVEFDEREPTAAAETTEAPVGAVWDDEFWDVAEWGGDMVPYREWLTAENEGTVGAPRIKLSCLSAQVSLTAVDVAYIEGGII